MTQRGVLAACLGAALCLLSSAAPAQADNIDLTVVVGATATDIQLTWSGGQPVYGVYRSTTANAVVDPAKLTGQTRGTSWVDSPPAAPILYYLVVNPPCTFAGDCSSGFCVDGACCGSACAGTCTACDLAGSVGTCANIPSGQDPANECVGTTMCNGSGGCQLRANGQPCATAVECQSGVCADGLCCSTTCTAPCKACDLLGSEGACVNVPFQDLPHHGTCPSCGLCNGSGTCCTTFQCSFPGGACVQ